MHWRIAQKPKGSKARKCHKFGGEEPAALFSRTVFSLSGSKSSSDSFITAAISWFVLLIPCLLPIYAQLILLCSAEESQADEPVVKSLVSNLETLCSCTYICT